MKKLKINYLRAIIICHGKSEVIFAKSLKSNLKLKVEVDSDENGAQSIQLTSLLNYLKSKGFKDTNEILKNYPLINHTKKKLHNFKLFIIMDIDEKELTPRMIEDYISGTMFSKFDYKDYVVPIFNDKNLDTVLQSLGYEIDIKNKVSSYKKVFPGTNGDLKAFIKIKEDFRQTNKSNMTVLLDYLYDCLKNN